MRTIESKEDCTRMIERLIWELVDSSFGDFNGIKELNRDALIALRAAADDALRGSI